MKKKIQPITAADRDPAVKPTSEIVERTGTENEYFDYRAPMSFYRNSEVADEIIANYKKHPAFKAPMTIAQVVNRLAELIKEISATPERDNPPVAMERKALWSERDALEFRLTTMAPQTAVEAKMLLGFLRYTVWRNDGSFVFCDEVQTNDRQVLNMIEGITAFIDAPAPPLIDPVVKLAREYAAIVQRMHEIEEKKISDALSESWGVYFEGAYDHCLDKLGAVQEVIKNTQASSLEGALVHSMFLSFEARNFGEKISGEIVNHLNLNAEQEEKLWNAVLFTVKGFERTVGRLSHSMAAVLVKHTGISTAEFGADYIFGEHSNPWVPVEERVAALEKNHPLPKAS